MRTASTSLVTRLSIPAELHPVEEAHRLALRLLEDLRAKAIDDGLADLEGIALTEVEHHVGDDGERREQEGADEDAVRVAVCAMGPVITAALSQASAGQLGRAGSP